LFGAIAGVFGIVAALTVSHGLDAALADPAAAGVTWDATVLGGTVDYAKGVDEVAPAFVRAARDQRDAAAVAVVGRAVVDVNGAGVPVFDVKPVRGRVSLVTIAGRAPTRPDEAAIGPSTARQLGVGIGERVTITGHGKRTFRIVGEALFPNEVHSGFTEGVWVTPAAMRVVGQSTDVQAQTGMEQTAVLRWRPGVDHRVALTRLRHSMSGDQRTIDPAEIPPELQNLRRVRSMPTVLVLFLVLLAISTLAHVLVTTVRRRRSEFAVLRTLGFTRRMTVGLVATHGTAVGVVGLLVGIPLGVMAGRLAWSWVTEEVPLVYSSPVTVAALLLAVPATLLVTNLVAALPGRRAARLTPASILRAE
jgi:ABC-type lipoprotein release transport system permease subunit